MPLMRVLRLVLRPFNPVFARRIEQMIVLDSTDQRVDSSAALRAFPLPLTSLDAYVQRRYAGK